MDRRLKASAPATTPNAAPDRARYVVAVRALCEFTAKEGDLDLRFTPSPTAMEGMAGHAVVAARRGDNYEREVRLEGDCGPLRVRGRADGYDTFRYQLEEIKTYRGDLDAMPANHRQLHWAQLKVYGHLFCQQRGVSKLRLALVYFDITSQKETELREVHSAADLEAFFTLQCYRFLAWAEQEMAHRSARDAALKVLRFPHADFRPGQRQLAEAMYKASSRACCLLAQAPTGIGKTVGSLFPMLKACAEHGVDKIFFLAAKTSGRRLALDACAVLQQGAAPALEARSASASASASTPAAAAETIRMAVPAPARLPLRAIELVARTNACEYPDKACHGDSCPLAKGFYDRLPAARSAALAINGPAILDKAALREVALEHQVCPYYLGAELVRWSDVVVGDYNYYFDISAMLYSLTLANDWKVNVLVDEAHNMVSRARSMYSAELVHEDLKLLRKIAPEALKKPLDKVNRVWNQLEKSQDADYQVYPDIAEKLINVLQTASTSIGDHFAAHPRSVEPDLQRFYFDVMNFMRLTDSYGAHSLFDVSKDATGSRLCIRNIVPAPFLKQRFETSHSTALFSATLSPWNYYNDLLGMPAGTAWVDVESPFEAEQLSVRVARHISTRYQHRDASLRPIADLMARQYADTPGNYLAFFSSFDYLDKAATQFAERHPEVPLWRQSRRMDEASREQFLARFTHDSRGIGFAVLGGAFGEGVDLPGARLIGAFIATLGLPQMNPVNEQIRLRMDGIFGAGYDYTYTYPGLQKVVQAAGRVIRTRSDRGVVYLIDDRYAQAEIQQLMPGWWEIDNAAADRQ